MAHKDSEIEFKPLVPNDISDFKNEGCLYSLDFRAISENMDYDIPAMFKYENLMPWVLEGKQVCANENSGDIPYSQSNRIVALSRDSDSRVSLYKRLNVASHLKDVDSLYVGIPHPDADSLCSKNGLALNYTMEAFNRFNDKIAQKHVFGSYTPEWSLLSNSSEVKSGSYIKRQHGSGGYTVIAPSDDHQEIDFSYKWYQESLCVGSSCSVQIYKEGRRQWTVYGYATQDIAEGKYFTGARLHHLSKLSAEQRRQITAILSQCEDFLSDYKGFMGMDFILTNEGKIFALELNVRFTAVTIPTLLFNVTGAEESIFIEDCDEWQDSDLVLTYGEDVGTADILKGNP